MFTIMQVPSTEEGNDFEVEDTEPITVSSVVSASPAQVAGLKVGDEILAVNGRLIAFSTLDEVLAVLRAAGERTAPVKLLLLAKQSQ
jgi:C-terminal processing protease CtpA/Prc